MFLTCIEKNAKAGSAEQSSGSWEPDKWWCMATWCRCRSGVMSAMGMMGGCLGWAKLKAHLLFPSQAFDTLQTSKGYMGQTKVHFQKAEPEMSDNMKFISHGFSRANSFILSIHLQNECCLQKFHRCPLNWSQHACMEEMKNVWGKCIRHTLDHVISNKELRTFQCNILSLSVKCTSISLTFLSKGSKEPLLELDSNILEQ